jgi:hypothetical protein
MLNYSSRFDTVESVAYGLGFYALQMLYFLLYVSSINKENAKSLTFLFLMWLIMTWLTLIFSYVDRLNVVFSALFLFLSIECEFAGWKKKIHNSAIVGLVILSLLGNFKTIEKVSNSNDIDFDHSMSPYVPYNFFWSEYSL